MTAIKYSLLGISAYLLFLIWQLPINHVLARMPSLPVQIKIYGAQGSIIDGNAALIEKDPWRFEKITWSLYKWQLFKGRLEFISLFNNLDQSTARIRAGINLLLRPYLSRSRARLPLNALEPLWRPLPINLSGWLNIKLDYLNWSAHDLSTKGQVNIDDLMWENNLFGNFLINLDTATIKNNNNSQQVITGQINDKNGPLQINGEIQLDISGNWKINGTIMPRPDTQLNIKHLFNFLGSPNAEGRYQFAFNGRIPIK